MTDKHEPLSDTLRFLNRWPGHKEVIQAEIAALESKLAEEAMLHKALRREWDKTVPTLCGELAEQIRCAEAAEQRVRELERLDKKIILMDELHLSEIKKMEEKYKKLQRKLREKEGYEYA